MLVHHVIVYSLRGRMPQTACGYLYSFSKTNSLSKTMHFQIWPPIAPSRGSAGVWDFGMLLLATSSTIATSFIEIHGGAVKFDDALSVPILQI